MRQPPKFGAAIKGILSNRHSEQPAAISPMVVQRECRVAKLKGQFLWTSFGLPGGYRT
jgi:hypothetical protein